MTPSKAKELVRKKFPDYVISWCISYRGSYIVMAHPDEGPEDLEHGAYPDPYYAVSKTTGKIRSFVPAAEPDFGNAFFEAVASELGRR